MQQPHPEIWIPGAGSLETMEFVARHRYAYMGIPYFHLDVFERTFQMFRDACDAEGYEADPLQSGWLVPIYVAETDEQARREYEEHFWYFVKRLLPGITIQPPGYTSVRSLENILKGAGSFMLNVDEWDEIEDGHYAIVGSPETVTEQLVDAPRAASAPATCSASSSSAASRRPHAEEPRAVRGRGHAPAAGRVPRANACSEPPRRHRERVAPRHAARRGAAVPRR